MSLGGTRVASVMSGSSAIQAAGAWAAAVTTNGGSVSAARLALITTYINSMMACGAWNQLDDAIMLVAEDAPSALTSLKARRLATVTAAPTFAADTGYAFNGTSQFVDTGFVPSTMALAMKFSNIRMSIYERTNVATNTTSIGSTGTGGTITLRARNASSQFAVNIGNTPAANFTGITDSRGLLAASYPGSATTNAWQNGVALTTISGQSLVATALNAFSFYIGARNSSGTADQFRASTVGYADFGAPYANTGMELAAYNALNVFMTAVGANV